jgi:hypothetical protein
MTTNKLTVAITKSYAPLPVAPKIRAIKMLDARFSGIETMLNIKVCMLLL